LRTQEGIGLPMRTLRVVLVFALCTVFLVAWAAFAPRTISPPGAVVAHRVASSVRLPAARPLPRVQWGVAQPRQGQASPPGNFPFQTATSADGKVIVHYYNRPAGFGQQAISTIQGYLQHPIADTLGFTLKQPVNIYIYANRADFLAGAQPTNAAETGAYALPSESKIYLPLAAIPSDDADTYLPHELTHIVFHQNEDSGTLQGEVDLYPKWLDEGLAEHDVLNNSSGAFFDTEDLAQAVATGSVVNLLTQFTTNYPSDPNVDGLCYAEARSFIGYLLTTYGATVFHTFIAALPNGEILLAAEQYFGADLQTLQNKWRASIGTSALPHDSGPTATVPAPLPYVPGHLGGIATQTQAIAVAGRDQFSGNVIRIAFLLTLVALAFIAAGWFQMLQRRRRLAAVRAAEMFLGIGTPMPPTGPPVPGYGANLLPSGPIPSPYGNPTPDPPLAPREPSPPSTDGAGNPVHAGGLRGAAPRRGFNRPLSLRNANRPPFWRNATRPRLTEVPRVRWWEMVIIAAVAPVVLITQLIAATATASAEWSQTLVATTVVAVIAIVALAGLAVLAAVQRRLTVAQIGGILVAIIILVGVRVEASAAGLAQGKAYEDQGAYALAVRVYTDAGAPGTTLGRVENNWGQADVAAQDDANAVTHLRNAVSDDPANATYRAALLNEVHAYGQTLVAAQQFALAESDYADEAKSSTCDAECRPDMLENAGHVLLAWANLLMLQGNQTQALAKVQQVIHDEPHLIVGEEAQAILANQPNPLPTALMASIGGQYDEMNLLLQLAATQQPGGATASEAAEVPVAVNGTIKGATRGTGGERAIFLAFTSQSAAQGFLSPATTTDASVFKFATTINADGSYTVRLAPGYWYLVLWDDASQPGNLNFSRAADFGVFMVVPFATQYEATIMGA
jgi:tetratricopeptide (TPR) repeat protein